MKKIITALIMAAIIFCLPVSAVEEPVYLHNYNGISWQWSSSSSPNWRNIYEFSGGDSNYFGQTTSLRAFPGIYFQAELSYNTTYHVKFWFDCESITGTTISDFFTNEILKAGLSAGQHTNDWSPTITTNSLGKELSELIASTLQISEDTATYDIYFNTSSGSFDTITEGLATYALCFQTQKVSGSSGSFTLTLDHVQVEAWYDKEAEIYEEILDQIATNQEVIIDNQGTIINYGSGNQLPSGGSQLSQVESQLSFAEEAVLNKSSDLKESVADDWNNQKSDAREFVNTIAPSTQVFLTVYNDFVSVLPDNVKILFVVLPLLIFIGWLVGRIN